MRMRLILTLFLTLCGVVGCELEDEPGSALDGSVTLDGGDPSEPDDEADAGGMDTQEDPPCITDDDCTDPSLTCFQDEMGSENLCAECLDNTDCPMDRPFCGVEGLCSDVSEGVCRDPLDCEDPDRPQCDTLEGDNIGTCVECLSDNDCVSPRAICGTTGSCVQSQDEAVCTEDSECGVLRRCVDDACVGR